MTQNNTAQVIPVQLHRSKLRIYRPQIQKPDDERSDNYSNVREFSPEVVKQQISMFCREVSALIMKRATVSVNTDETGINVTVISPDFQLSMIYTDGGAK